MLPNAAVDFDAYPLCVPAVRNLEQIDFHPNVTFFVGENGAGKSTVLEALAMALGLSSEGGTRHARVETVGLGIAFARLVNRWATTRLRVFHLD